MMLIEHVAKSVAERFGIRVPRGYIVRTAEGARRAAEMLASEVVVKAQVPVGGRGKAGAIRIAGSPSEAELCARSLLGTSVAGHMVESVLVERRVAIRCELYAAVATSFMERCPVLLFSTTGGVDVEELYAAGVSRVLKVPVDIRKGVSEGEAWEVVSRAGVESAFESRVSSVLVAMFRAYRELDAELVEVNPLAITAEGEVCAVDCKIVIDESALARHPELPALRYAGTALERRARELGLNYVELDGDVGVLANGAGLTMATLDAVVYYGGRPANFLEVGGMAYKKAADALGLVLAKPGVKSLLVNLCGAFARTDVIMGGIVEGWKALRPEVPAAFCVRGMGAREAVRILEEELGVEPYASMDEAVRAAVAAAASGEGRSGGEGR